MVVWKLLKYIQRVIKFPDAH